MKPYSSTALLATAILALGHSSASASSFDNFEGGLTAGWNTSGDVSIQNVNGSNAVVLTNAYIGGVDDAAALNNSGINPTAAGGALETAAGVAVGGLDLDPINQATEGSVFWRVFTVAAGETLSFDWQFATADSALPDYGFVAIAGSVFTLADVADATDVSTDPDYLGQTALSHFEYVFASGGTFRIAFGVVDIGDYTASSELRVDNVSVGAAPALPEPVSTLALAGFAMVGCMVAARRRSAAVVA